MTSPPMSKEQQREARRQKVLARSQAGHPSPVVDLATQKQDVVGASAELDDHKPEAPSMDDGTGSALKPVGESGKSAAKLAAERRRQRILSKSNERMAKVQGDRLSGGGTSAAAREGDAGENLDEMLDAAEMEFFGREAGEQGSNASIQIRAESKTAPSIQGQTYFKSTPAAPAPAESYARAEAAAQSKPTVGRASAGAFKPSRLDEIGVSTTRRTGNKALDRQPFDMAAVQSLARSANLDKGRGQSSLNTGRKRLLGGVRYWVGLEAVTKAILLLLVGAGVGGMLLPEGRAAVAQAKFAAAHRRGTSDAQWRSNLELLLATGVRQLEPEGAKDCLGDVSGGEMERDPSDDDEFGAFSSESANVVEKRSASLDERERREAKEAVVESEKGELVESREGQTGEASVEATTSKMGENDEVEKQALFGDAIHAITDGFLQFIDCVLRCAHGFSSMVMPLGIGGRIPCVPALFLAMLVRLVVSTVFLGIRIVLGLPAFPPAVGNNKPGMIMGVVLATVPTLGKVIAVATTIKSILSDTTLVVTGTVLTLTLCLGGEDGSGPRRLVSSMFGVFKGSSLLRSNCGETEL